MKQNNFRVMARLAALVKPLSGYLGAAVLMGLAGHLCAAFLTVFAGYAVLDVLGLDAPAKLSVLFLCMGLFALARGFLRYAEQACNHYIAFKLLALIRDKVFGALRRLCPAKLEGRDRGDLIAVITSDIELLEVFYAHTLSPAAIALLFCTVLCAFLASYHPAAALLALAAYLVVGVVIPLAVSRASGDAGLRFRTKSGELSSLVLDSLRGLSETIQYGDGISRLDRIRQETQALAEDEVHMKRLAGRGQAVTGAVIFAFDALMLFLCAALYQAGAVGFDGVVIPVLALMSSFGPVVALANLGGTLQNTFAAANRVLALLDEAPVVDEIRGEAPCRFRGAEAQDVRFSYGGEEILSGLSMEIPRGSVIGVVGKSGSGKSTLLKLFLRFWETQSGRVSVSGRSVNEINTADLRTMESYVTQDTHLFHDSIAANLRIAKPDATQAKLEDACRKASVHDFIQSLPQGYDTPVGELGDTLSGGERQRLGLARAFLHNAPFLLLDEPTSNLDSLNEAAILKSLGQAREGRTVVLVSHRRSTLRIADRIVAVENGRSC